VRKWFLGEMIEIFKLVSYALLGVGKFGLLLLFGVKEKREWGGVCF
jgi:hypothetical protein